METLQDFNDASVLEHTLQTSRLSRLFFSKGNIELIQFILKSRVYQSTGLVIDNQSPKDLLIVMKSYYLRDSRDPGDSVDPSVITNETKRLNDLLISAILPEIIAGVIARGKFIDGLTAPRTVLSRPISTTIAGTRTDKLR